MAASKGVEITATRNLPLSICADAKEIPDKLKRHPGGARVERGTKITVSEDRASKLKSLGYAKALLVLLLPLALLFAAPAAAQTYSAASTVTAQQECGQYAYEGSFTISDSTVTYVSPELDISEAERQVVRQVAFDSAGTVTSYVYGPLAFVYAKASEIGTEAVDIDVDFSFDGATWITAGEVQANVGTTAVTDTLSVIAGAVPAGWSYGRWLRLKFDPTGSSGVYQGMTFTYRALIPKRMGAPCTAKLPVLSS